MRVGVQFDWRNPPQWRMPWDKFYREQIEAMCYLEDLGFDIVWVSEHHFTADGQGSGLEAFMGVLAAKTKRIRVGTYIKIFPLFHPLLVAEEMAVLDNLLGGRLELGLGLGYRPVEFSVLGVPVKQRSSRMEEGLEILKLAWTQDKVSYHGRRFSFDNVDVQPKPLQKPHPPIWYGARSVVGARRAARHRCHLALASADPQVVSTYYETLEEMGEDPAQYHITGGAGTITCTYEDPEKVWQQIRPHAAYRWGMYDEMMADAGDPLLRLQEDAQAAREREYRGYELIGDPETILRALEMVREARAWKGLKFDTMITACTPPPGLSIKEFISSYELFAKEVLPIIQKW